MLGALAFGIFAAIQSVDSDDRSAGALQRAQTDAAHLNAQTEAFDAGALAPADAVSADALEAYGQRWSALSTTASFVAPSARAIQAYGDRWTATGERFATQTPSAATIEAYGARWAGLRDLYLGS